LGHIFAAIPNPDDPDLIVGFGSSDDGAVYRLNERTTLVQSVDFFTPIVDDPADFGAISAANALSDIYAMGGRPRIALSLVCFPYKTLPLEILTAIVAGGARKIIESGALVVGGHSVEDPEIKFGYAVTGEVAPGCCWSNDTPEPGDVLVLTKPLGTGLLTTAVKQDKLPAEFLIEPIAQMKRLNRAAAEAAGDCQIHAATDVTGFGLLGHLFEMVRGRGLGARVETAGLALFEGVRQAIELGALTAAHRTNREYVTDYDLVANAALGAHAGVLFDPQTGGGLLFALPPAQAGTLLDRLAASGHRACRVGQVTAKAAIECV